MESSRGQLETRQKTPLLNEITDPPSVAGLLLCLGAYAPGLLLCHAFEGITQPQQLPSQTERRPPRRTYPPRWSNFFLWSKFCLAVKFSAWSKFYYLVEIFFHGSDCVTSSTMMSAYFSSSSAGVGGASSIWPGLRVTSCLSV